MTDPTKALADAARLLLSGIEPEWLNPSSRDDMEEVQRALAAYDAAQATEQVPPTDEEIEAAINAFGQAVFEAGKVTGKPQWVTDMMTRSDVVAASHKALLALMRRARPNRQAPDSALLQAAKAVVDGAQVFLPSDASPNILMYLRTLRVEVERASKGGAA